MTERAIEAILADAGRRWSLLGVRVIHRIGRLEAGEPIVLVGTASSHRGDALAACEFIMDYVKTRAPLWKKEITAAGEHWVEARARDRRAAERWSRGSEGSQGHVDRKSTRLNSSHVASSYAVFCLQKKQLGTTARAGMALNSAVGLQLFYTFGP